MIYVIMGPTCSHKTATAVKVAKLKHAPIINGDAFQIYQDMDVGTAKIRKDEEGYELHHLLDIRKPNESFSVMEYQEIGRKCLNDLLAKNENVVIVGGTGLYIKALLFDYEFRKEDNNDTSELDKLTNEELHLLLEEKDPQEAKKIHVNNRKRLIRALSMMENNQIVKSELIASQKHVSIYPEVKLMFINPERNKLYEEINQRVTLMVEQGLIKEVQSLLNKYDLSLTARAAIGYKEVIDYLEGKLNKEECIALIQKRTRNYAKRQVTFFKHQFPGIEIYENGESLIKTLEE